MFIVGSYFVFFLFIDIFRRFSARLFPASLFGGADSDSDEDNTSALGFPAIDSKKANSTSTVKVCSKFNLKK